LETGDEGGATIAGGLEDCDAGPFGTIGGVEDGTPTKTTGVPDDDWDIDGVTEMVGLDRGTATTTGIDTDDVVDVVEVMLDDGGWLEVGLGDDVGLDGGMVLDTELELLLDIVELDIELELLLDMVEEVVLLLVYGATDEEIVVEEDDMVELLEELLEHGNRS
jgi:hypothetical protein